MRVIPPITITDALLTSSNVTETDYPVHNMASTYALGERVIVVSSNFHMVYESLKNANTGNNPVLDNQDAPINWLEVGPTNRWRMFDLLRNTQTEQATPLTVTLTPGERIDSLALLGLDAESVTVTMTSGGSTVYTHTESLIERQTLTWLNYFFGAFTNRKAVVLFDLPLYTNGILTISISRAAGNVKCGSLVIGNNEYLGNVQYQAESDALNFSIIERDEFGNSKLKPRRTIPKTNQTLFVEKSRINRILGLRDDLNAVPAVWSGVEDATDGYFGALNILGVYKQFKINLGNSQEATLSLELEEI